MHEKPGNLDRLVRFTDPVSFRCSLPMFLEQRFHFQRLVFSLVRPREGHFVQAQNAAVVLDILLLRSEEERPVLRIHHGPAWSPDWVAESVEATHKASGGKKKSVIIDVLEELRIPLTQQLAPQTKLFLAGWNFGSPPVGLTGFLNLKIVVRVVLCIKGIWGH